MWNIIIIVTKKKFVNENAVRALTMEDFCHPRLRLHFIVVPKPYIYIPKHIVAERKDGKCKQLLHDFY